jgi:hypothetical protein
MLADHTWSSPVKKGRKALTTSPKSGRVRYQNVTMSDPSALGSNVPQSPSTEKYGHASLLEHAVTLTGQE